MKRIKVHFKEWEEEQSFCGRAIAEGETFIYIPFSKEHLPCYPPANSDWCTPCFKERTERRVRKKSVQGERGLTVIERGKQVGEMDLWVKLPGIKVKPVADFLRGYYRALWPDLIEEVEHSSPGMELFFYRNQRTRDVERYWGVTTATAPDVAYIQIHPGKGVNITYSNTTPEEHLRVLEIKRNLQANRDLLGRV